MRHPQIAATNQKPGLRMADQSEAWIVLTQSAEIENMNNEYVNSIHYHQLHSQLHPPSNYHGPSFQVLHILIQLCPTCHHQLWILLIRIRPLFCSLVSWPIQFAVTLNQVSRILGNSLSLSLIALMTDGWAMASHSRPAITQTAIWKYISQFLISWTSEKLFWQLNL